MTTLGYLDTPWAIYDNVKRYFPLAVLEVVRTSPLVLKLQLAKGLEAIELGSAVISEVFSAAIATLALRTRLRGDFPPLDPAMLSTGVPLSNWQFFVRHMYEASGKTCEALILEYLHGAAEPIPDQLTRLGLAPPHVEPGGTEDDFRRFTLMLEHLVEDDPKRARFQTRYPITAAHILSTLSQKERIDAILNYLQMPQDAAFEELVRLGIAPYQIEEEITVDVVQCFRLAIKGIARGDSKIVQFRTTYPMLARHIAIEIEREKLESEVKEDLYASILGRLQEKVVGQEIATKLMASVLSNIEGEGNSVVLEVGPTGIGKTELANTVATFKSNRMVVFHMNLFSESHSVSSLFGSPIGYTGSSDKPQFALELGKYPSALSKRDSSTTIVRDMVVLFDEIEKAHSTVKQSLLTLFDEGKVTIRYTEEDHNITHTYLLKRCVIIATSNLCKEPVLAAFQHGLLSHEIVEVFKRANRALSVSGDPKSFSEELIGRVRVIPFGPIPRGDVYQNLLKFKIEAFLHDIKKDVRCRAVKIDDLRNFLILLEEKLYGEGIDIRRIKEYLENIKHQIHQNRAAWGVIQNIQIAFSPNLEDGNLYMNISTFSELLDGYIPTPGVEPLILGSL